MLTEVQAVSDYQKKLEGAAMALPKAKTRCSWTQSTAGSFFARQGFAETAVDRGFL
jgi:hypothetical protein